MPIRNKIHKIRPPDNNVATISQTGNLIKYTLY